MNKFLILSLLALSYEIASATSLLETFGSGANAFTVDFVRIGNPGNAADTGIYHGTSQPYSAGSVAYNYNLAKYEISRDMINKANAEGNLGITLFGMSSYGGNGINRPATGISWNEAARFVNWLNTSKGYQAAYNFTTSGANDNITLWRGGQASGSNQYRHKDAYYFLPSADEWYKGAYGSPSGTWYNFPNGSDSVPTAVSGGTSGAVYGQSLLAGPADITNAGSLSAWGTMAQGGNVHEWIESSFDGSNNSPTEYRELRGGSWDVFSGDFIIMEPQYVNRFDPTDESNRFNFGFRIASVPEPSSLSLLALGGVVVALRRRR